MQRKLIKPIFKIIISILGFSLLTFWLLSIAPGDPAAILIRQKGMIPEQALLESTREALGLNQPFIVRYGIWLSHLLQGNLGQSFITNQSVLHELSLRMHPTLILIGHAWLFFYCNCYNMWPLFRRKTKFFNR